jgi:hypothetical protein
LIALGASPFAAAQNATQGTDELLDFSPRARPPAGYAPAYAAIVRAAEDEGRLVVYSTTDLAVAQPLIDDFRSLYPRIAVEYEDLTSTELHHRFVAETQLGRDTADVLWSSAMDLQASLVEQDYALAYASPESAGLPDWARLRDQAWATTFEPIVFAYNKKLVPRPPRTHAEFATLLERTPALKGKVITYDVEKSGLGFLLAAQDARATPAFWDVARALGRADVRFAATTSTMLGRVASGRLQRARRLCAGAGAAQPGHRRRVSRGPHAGALAPAVDRPACRTAERGTAVAGLHAVAARAVADRAPGHLRHARGREGRGHGGAAVAAARRDAPADRARRGPHARPAAGGLPCLHPPLAQCPGAAAARRLIVGRTGEGARSVLSADAASMACIQHAYSHPSCFWDRI